MRTQGGVNHSDTLNNLTNGSTYNYYIRCQDVANNINTSDYTLTFSVAAGVSSSVCGNGIVESGEQCDGSNLNGASCTSQGYSGGALSCSSSSCQFVTTSCTSASGGVTYHVRTDGSDTTCNGKSNTSASAAPNCAFRNPQKAADSIAPGDDIIIHPGTYSAFTIRGTNSGGTFQATAANPTIIEGESGVARDQITITGGVAKAAFYSGGGAGSSSRTRYLTIRHLHLTAGTEAALMLDGEHSDFVIKDIVIDDVDSLGVSPTGESGCRGKSLPCYGGRHDPTQRDAALYVNYAGGPIYQGNGLLEDIKIVGTPQYCATTQGNGGTICGVDANAISLAASFTNVRRVEAEYFLGNFLIRAPSDGIVEYNMVKNFGCDSDDGCIQLYNVSNSTIRYNVFSNATPINEALAVIRTRRTSSSTSQPSAKIYNNTFIGYTTGFTASHRKKAVEIAPPGTVGALTGSIVIKNNIFMNNYGSTTSNAGAVSITDCPTSLDVDNNLYFNNNKNFVNVAGCSGTFEANAQYANPQLDLTTFAPNMGSPACSGGDSSVDSNQGGDFIGALGCSSTPPARSNGLPSGTLPYTTTQTIMSLVTDKNATCKYGTTANTSYTALPNTFTTTGASTHSTQLSTLTLGTSYTYYVRCRDAQRNTNTNDFTISFSVASTPVGAPGGTPPGSTPGGGGTPPANSTTGTGAGTQTTPTTSPANGNNSTLGNISLTSAQIQATLDAAKQRLRRIDSALVNRLLGRILLEVEEHGEAWYLDPVAKLRYYLANGPEAYQALRQFGLGITDADIAKIPAGVESRFKDLDTDGDGLPDRMEEGLGTDLANSDSDGDGFNDGMEVFNNFSPLGPGVLALDQQLTNRLRGRIVIQAEKQGQAWYINPVDGKRYYMKNGEAAYQIMRFLSLGITNHDIDAIGVGEVTGVYQP